MTLQGRLSLGQTRQPLLQLGVAQLAPGPDLPQHLPAPGRLDDLFVIG